MKKVAVAILLSIVFVSCEGAFPETPECLEVSLVNETCGYAVLKIEDPLYYHLGETVDGHSNVFFTFFNCEDMEKEKEETFYVSLQTDQQGDGCAVCLAVIDYQGEKRYPVKIVDACTQEMTE